jgi:rhamnopyranosyl-N-acetylglucosaminyl-diphospho-decaprenol beta-1,3/1,4-galactofuranosyltransferase
VNRTTPREPVAAVIVTHNRVALLQECLAAVQNQTAVPANILVVDNASTDETPEVLASNPHVLSRRLPVNIGGAGGFAAGISWALELGHPWIWLMDDDTMPTSTALGVLVDAAASHEARSGHPPSVLASKVLWTDGAPHKMNRVGLTGKAASHYRDRSRDSRQMRYSTFVSTMLNADAVRRFGLPLSKYFIWSDDIEYTARILRREVGIYVPESVVIHATRKNSTWLSAPPDRIYYHVRNTIWMLAKSRAFSRGERAARAGRFIAGGLLYLVLSRQKRAAVTNMVRGIVDGTRSRPS